MRSDTIASRYISRVFLIGVIIFTTSLVWYFNYIPHSVAAVSGLGGWLSEEPLAVSESTERTFSGDICWPYGVEKTQPMWDEDTLSHCFVLGEKVDVGHAHSYYYASYKGQSPGYLNEISGSVILNPGTDTALSYYPPNSQGDWSQYSFEGVSQVDGYLRVYKHLAESLVQSSHSFYKRTYRLDRAKADYPTDGREIIAEGAALSPNGRYLAYVQKIDTPGILQLVFVDTEANSSKVISVFDESDFRWMSLPRVTDSGSYVGVEWFDDFKLWSTGGTCGVPDDRVAVDVADFCPARVIDVHESAPNLGCGDTFVFDKVFTDSELRFLCGSQGNRREVFVSPAHSDTTLPADEIPGQVEYLALGDSYSSGEGDIGKNSQGGSYYRTLTDVNNYNCHISSRSYPFLLRDFYGIASDKMQSVACSGAKVFLDYYHAPASYQGQGNRIANKSSDEKARLRQDALERFIPGLTPQLEFVKKYQPKVVTLTGGGNDVGFAEILQYCASPTWQMIVIDDTCGYANNEELRHVLGVSIRDQYNYTKQLIRLIHAASPDTVIYVVGYPSFIADSRAKCALNSGALNGAERDMINNGLTYLNTILRRAAQISGAYYVDIENSLKGGRICEGSSYVTGLWDVGLSNKEGRVQSFHPNSLGHQKIANTIEDDDSFSLIGSPSPVAQEDIGPPMLPVYFKGDVDLASASQYIMTDDVATVYSDKTLKLPPNALRPESTAIVTIFSRPKELGRFEVGSDGSLSTQISLPPSAGPGYHTIVVSGFSPSNERVSYYQFIELQGENSDDIDGDGIPNAADKCQYIEHWYDEDSGKDVCSDSDLDLEEPLRAVSVPTSSEEASMHDTGLLVIGGGVASPVDYGNLAYGLASPVESNSNNIEELFSAAPNRVSNGDAGKLASPYLSVVISGTVVVIMGILCIIGILYRRKI